MLNRVTKEEFVNCMLENPLLSETLRGITTTDAQGSVEKGMKLKVSMLDPKGTAEEEELLDMMDVQQSVLFEVWDHVIGMDTYLGEAYLPSLGNIGEGGKDIALHLKRPEDGDDGTYRYKRKEGVAVDEKGVLFVNVSWKMPVDEDTAAAAMDPKK